MKRILFFILLGAACSKNIPAPPEPSKYYMDDTVPEGAVYGGVYRITYQEEKLIEHDSFLTSVGIWAQEVCDLDGFTLYYLTFGYPEDSKDVVVTVHCM